MSAYATCKFPLVDQWKDSGDKNPIVGFVDSLLSGFAQIAFSDNPVCGLLLIIGAYIGSPIQAISAVWAACVATLIAHLIGTPKILIRLGLYTFNAALAGLGIPLFVYSNVWILPEILIYSTIGAVLCVLLTAGFSAVLSKWDTPSLALPYCVTLFVLVPASLILSGLHTESALIPYLQSESYLKVVSLSAEDFFIAMLNGFSEIIWQANAVSGAIYLVAVVVSSRIDALTAIVAVAISTLVAVGLNLPMGNMMIGIYGYNAVLVSQALFGRAYKMSIRSFLFTIVLAILSVILTVALAALFAPIGAPVAAFPFVIIAVIAMLGRDGFAKLVFVSPLKWGVPETIAKELKKGGDNSKK